MRRSRIALAAIVLLGLSPGSAPGADCNANGREDAEDLAARHPAFGEAVDFAIGEAGELPSVEPALADFDLDGDLDLAVVARDRGVIHLVRNAGQRSFREPEVVLYTLVVGEVAAADFDRDGAPDLAWEAGDSAVMILRGHGDGTFAEAERHPVLAHYPPRYVEPVDLDRDGGPDLVLGDGYLGKVYVLLNENGVDFAVEEHSTGEISYRPLLADLDRDGDIDLLVGTYAEQVYKLLRNPGDGKLEDAVNVVVEPHRVVGFAADIDGDAEIDLSDGSLVYSGDGRGGFSAGKEIGIQVPLLSPLVTDVDGDSAPDILDGGIRIDDGLLIALNSGKGTFAPALRYEPWRHRPITVADFDGDARSDVLGLDWGCNTASVLFRLPGLAPQSRDVDADGVPDECQLDCDLDGIPDAFAIRAGQSPDCNGNGIPDACDVLPPVRFRDGWQTRDLSWINSPVAADWDGDARLDLATLHEVPVDPPIVRREPDGSVLSVSDVYEVILAFNDGAGGFGKTSLVPCGEDPVRLRAGDIDADGDIDLIASDLLQKSVIVLPNRGDGSFADAMASDLPGWPYWLGTGDLDGDGILDAVASVAASPSSLCWALRGHGDGTFDITRRLFPAINGVLIDMDGDDLVDFVEDDQQRLVSLRRNTGDYKFDPQQKLAPGQLLATGDFDGDSAPDLILADTSCDRRFGLYNRGGGDFEEVDPFTEPFDWRLAAAADFDGDGRLDLAAGQPGRVDVFANDGSGRFPGFSRHAVPLPVPAPWIGFLPLPADVNGDGRPDLLALAFGPPGFAVLINESPPSLDRDRDGVPDACEVAGRQVIGDGNQDGLLNLSDPVWLLSHLFQGAGTSLPCSGGTAASPGAADLALLDANDDGRLDLADAVSVLGFLFQGDASSPRLGRGCEAVHGCPGACPAG